MRRGMAKAKGGVGKKIVRVTKRRFLPNLQYKRFWLENENRFIRIRVSTRGIRIIDKYGIEAVLDSMHLCDQLCG